MPALVINKEYADGEVLSASQLDAAFASITTLLNITGLGSDNLQDNSVGPAEIQTSGVTNTNLATNAVSTAKVQDAAITLSKLDPTGVQPFLVPTGVALPYCVNSSIAPTGYLICDGSAISRTTYGALFNVIGTIYGTGDGTATFNLPNASGRIFRATGGYSTEYAYALNSATANMYQDGATEDHTHPGWVQGGASPQGGASGALAASNLSNQFQQQLNIQDMNPLNANSRVDSSGSPVGVNVSGTYYTGVSENETRMINFQGQYIIKY